MNVNRQGKDECMLTTIAALSRVPLKEVRSMALELAQVKEWSEIITNHPLYWKVIAQLTEDVGLLERKIPNKRNFARGNRRYVLPKGIEGSVCSESPNDFCAHIDPFSNGLVWGTEREEPMTIKEYKLMLMRKDSKLTGIWY